jgi:hypothetical protein
MHTLPTTDIVNHTAREFDKQWIYDAETRDFAMYLDGELVGFARTPQEAEDTLDALVHEILTKAYGPSCTPPAEAEAGPAPAEEAPAPCSWCGGDGCKSVMQPAWCLDCVDATLKGAGAARQDLHRAPAEAAPAPASQRGSSIAHVAGLEVHGPVILSPAVGGIRRVFYGTPDACVALWNVTGTKVFSNAITGERIGALPRLLALATQRGPRELAWLNGQAA